MLAKIGQFASKIFKEASSAFKVAFKTAKNNPIKTTLLATGGVAAASHMMGKPGTPIETREEPISPEEAGAQAALMDMMRDMPTTQIGAAEHQGMMMGPAIAMQRG